MFCRVWDRADKGRRGTSEKEGGYRMEREKEACSMVTVQHSHTFMKTMRRSGRVRG